MTTTTMEGSQTGTLAFGPDVMDGSHPMMQAAAKANRAYTAAGRRHAAELEPVVFWMIRQLWPDAAEVVYWDEERGGGEVEKILYVRGRAGNLLWYLPGIEEHCPELIEGWNGPSCAELDEGTEETLHDYIDGVMSILSGHFPRIHVGDGEPDSLVWRYRYLRKIVVPADTDKQKEQQR